MGVLKKILNNPCEYLSFRRIQQSLEERLFIIWIKIAKLVPNDELYIRVFYRLSMHETLNLQNPTTYSQKIQWLKLHNTVPLYSKMVDKYEARKIVSELIGEKYLIPILGTWKSYEKIDFSSLPEQFVLKTTHDSGTVVICKEKTAFDHDNASRKLSKALQKNYFYKSREYPYKHAVPRIIAERYLTENNGEELTDYKFFCFHGEPKILQISSNRNSVKTVTYLDTEFNLLEFNTGDYQTDLHIIKPDNYKEMLEIARKLSQDLIHIRIDLYNIKGQIYFGEFTFHNSGGIANFLPEWNKILGDWILLPTLTQVSEQSVGY